MSDLQFIVSRLGEKPFGICVRAVDFDAKSPDELLDVLVNDVLGSLDPGLKTDVHFTPREDVVEQVVQFLLMHKCSLIPSPDDEAKHLSWAEGLHKANKEVVYPLLRWLLSEYEHLEKRTYLSRYLMPIDDVPSEYLTGNSNLEELLDAYRELQAEFVETHKHYESMKANNSLPASDVIDAISQMQEEEQQLLDKLRQEREQATNNPSFQALLAEASKLRQAQQDLEIRLEDQKKGQLHQKAATKRRLTQAQALLSISASCKDRPERLEDEHKQSVEHLEAVTQRHHEVEFTLLQAEKEAELDKTEGDLEYLVEMAAQLEDQLHQKQQELDRLGGRGAHLGELDGLRHEVEDAAAKQLEAKEAHDELELEKELLLSTNAGLRESIYADGNQMDRRELAEFEESVKRQLVVCDESKDEVRKLKGDIALLKQTEDALKGQHRICKERLHEEEERAGVGGFSDVNETLQKTSQQKNSLNQQKSETLDDISALVQKIAGTLEGKRKDLEPKIEELKQKRKQFQVLQERHESEKARHDDASAKLNIDNEEMAAECSRLQEEWTEKERMLTGQPREDSCEGGAKQSKEYIADQKAMFANLKKLLELHARAFLRESAILLFC